MANKRPKVEIMAKVFNQPGATNKYIWTLIYGQDEQGNEKSRADGYEFDTAEEAKADFFAVRNLMNKISHVR